MQNNVYIGRFNSLENKSTNKNIYISVTKQHAKIPSSEKKID